jgi:hypothetical protein
MIQYLLKMAVLLVWGPMEQPLTMAMLLALELYTLEPCEMEL